MYPLEPPSFADQLIWFVFTIAIWVSFLFWFSQGAIRLRSGLPRRLSYAVMASFLMGVTVSVAVVFTETHDRVSDTVEFFWFGPIVVLIEMVSRGYWGALAAGVLALALVGLSIPRAQNPAQRLKSFAFAGFVGAALPWAVVYAEGRYFESKLVSEAQALGLRCIEVRDFLDVLKDYDLPDRYFPTDRYQGLAYRDKRQWQWSHGADSWVLMERGSEHRPENNPCLRSMGRE